MSTNTALARGVAHTITAYGFRELHRSIATDSRKSTEEKLWSHVGALVAQLVTHVTIEAVGNIFESQD